MKTPNIFAACALAIGLSVVAFAAPAEAATMKKPMMMQKPMMMHKSMHPMCNTTVHGKKKMVMCHMQKDRMMMKKPMYKKM